MIERTRAWKRMSFAAASFCVAAVVMMGIGCGGSNSTPASPTSSPSPSPTPPPTPGTSTITITSAGVSPRTVTISAGSRVTFVNNDNRVHDMASDPHPEHTACPAINDVGFLQPTQSRTTGNLNTPRSCGFHDHNQPTNTSLQGTITIQ
jgi:plastocyanin